MLPTCFPIPTPLHTKLIYFLTEENEQKRVMIFFVNTPNCFMCAQLVSNFNNNHKCSVNINYWIHKQNIKHRNKKTIYLIPTDRKFPCPEDVGFLDRRCARDFRKSVSAEADKLVAAMLKLHKRQNINQSKLHAFFFILGHECCHQFWLHM